MSVHSLHLNEPMSETLLPTSDIRLLTVVALTSKVLFINSKML